MIENKLDNTDTFSFLILFMPKKQKDQSQEILEIVRFIKDHAASQESVDKIDKRLIKVEASMVTKDYLDEKLTDLRGDMVVMMRKEDTKVKFLVDVLHKKMITGSEVKQILRLEPFAQMV